MNNNPICFFDSGIGGSTILKEVIKKLPNENYIYLSDSNNNPYGNKTKEELFKIVNNNIKTLLKYKPKLIICACNTATTTVLDDIRKKYKDITFIGTEPAIKMVHDKYKNKKTIILTTKGTAQSERFKKLFNRYKTTDCTLVEAPMLASLIETGKNPYPYLKELLKNYTKVEVVVLGCTHFPLAKKEIEKVLGKVLFIDGHSAIANKIYNSLKDNNLLSLNNVGNLHIIAPNQNIKNKIIEIIKEN